MFSDETLLVSAGAGRAMIDVTKSGEFDRHLDLVEYSHQIRRR